MGSQLLHAACPVWAPAALSPPVCVRAPTPPLLAADPSSVRPQSHRGKQGRSLCSRLSTRTVTPRQRSLCKCPRCPKTPFLTFVNPDSVDVHVLRLVAVLLESLLIQNRPAFFPNVVFLSNSDESLHGMSHIHLDIPSWGHPLASWRCLSCHYKGGLSLE